MNNQHYLDLMRNNKDEFERKAERYMTIGSYRYYLGSIPAVLVTLILPAMPFIIHMLVFVLIGIICAGIIKYILRAKATKAYHTHMFMQDLYEFRLCQNIAEDSKE